MDDSLKRKVICPVEGKDKKTRWVRLGIGFVNQDNSITLHLDALPVNGKLQVREWEPETSWKERQQQQGFASIAAMPPPVRSQAANDDIPF